MFFLTYIKYYSITLRCCCNLQGNITSAGHWHRTVLHKANVAVLYIINAVQKGQAANCRQFYVEQLCKFTAALDIQYL